VVAVHFADRWKAVVAQMLPPKTMKTWPFTSAASSEARKVTSWEMFFGPTRRSRRRAWSPCPEEVLGHAGAGTGRNGVHGHAVALELSGEHPGHRGDARLGGRVVGLAGVAVEAGFRRRVDDAPSYVLAALGLGAPVDRREVRRREVALQVHSDHVVPVGLFHVERHLVPQDAGVVHQNVERPYPSTAWSTTLFAPPHELMSSLLTAAVPPAAVIVSTTSWAGVRSSPSPCSDPPRRSRSRSHLRSPAGLPLRGRSPPAPVTIATFSSSSPSVSSSFGERVPALDAGRHSGAAGAACSTRQPPGKIAMTLSARRVLEPPPLRRVRPSRPGPGCRRSARSGSRA